MEMLKAAADRVVGSKQVIRGLRAGTLSRVYIAEDADTFLFQQVVRASEDAGVPAVRVSTMKELGHACGLEIGAAAAGICR